ncbi:MAG TPA: PadR family transcriptional regulator [Candidatus Acidoferrum sp.]|jgi:DNA-binding PadR family transcriptional regulator|nr:PadR family transcriptional regulator [Candidatus Acidoferrum sp.]
MNDLLILANLLDRPKHGYALKKQVGLITGQGEMHSNLVYPLLRRFVESGWISKRRAAGQRGQTREIYALTAKGKQELLRRLGQFAGKEAASENGFHLRVGLFAVLDAATRCRVLAERDQWLAAREERLARLSGAVDVGLWGGEVVRFLHDRIRSERKWIARLNRKLVRPELS